jgi:L-alanine-DL-glutamate epimerase-like enolase superfamily enzyme
MGRALGVSAAEGARRVKITGVTTIHCGAGWRIWSFVKIMTSSKHIVGWSEVTESNGSPRAIQGAVEDLRELLIGEDPLRIEALYWKMYGRNRQSLGGAVGKAIAGIENALLDIKGKHYGVPVYELFGGPVRESIPLYWSHFGTSRVRAYDHVNELPIKQLTDVGGICQKARDSNYTTIKTNMPVFNNKPFIHMPGFSRTPGGPELNLTKEVYRATTDWIDVLRYNLPGVDIILDLNYNLTSEGCVRLIKGIEGRTPLHWVEIDTPDPRVLRDIKEQIQTPVCSCENLHGAHQYQQFIDDGAVDIVSIDVLWNGLLRSLEIAKAAALRGKNVTPHNHYSNLATFMSAHFCSLVPNLKIMEYDVDDVRWRDDLLTATPYIKDATLYLSDRPGWGADVNEQVLSGYRKFI